MINKLQACGELVQVTNSSGSTVSTTALRAQRTPLRTGHCNGRPAVPWSCRNAPGDTVPVYLQGSSAQRSTRFETSGW